MFFWMVKLHRLNFLLLPSLKLTLRTCQVPIKWKQSSSNHPFSGSILVSKRVTFFLTSGYFLLLIWLSLGIHSYSQLMIGVSNHLLSIVFRSHYHSQKVIGSLGFVGEMIQFEYIFTVCFKHQLERLFFSLPWFLFKQTSLDFGSSEWH